MLIKDKNTGEVFTWDAHQVEAYDHLVDNPRALLFLGMSLSKTVVTLTYLYDMIYREAAITKTLVVAPDKVARITWPDELEKWEHLAGARYSVLAGTAKQRLKALAADAEIFIIGIDNLTWLIDLYIQERNGKYTGALPFDCIVLDEASLFKSRDSKRFKALRRAIKTVPYRIGLTGTPAPNGYVDLWATVLLIDDGQRLGSTFGAFQDKYFKVRGNGMVVYEYIPRPGAVNTIAGLIQDIALTMETRDKIKLPPLHTVDEVIELEPYDREVYDELEREYVLDVLGGGEVTVKTAADLTNKLLQISSGAVYEDREDPKAPRVWHELNTAKLDRLAELLEKYPNDNFILVYQFTHEVERVRARFPFARLLKKIQDVRDWNAGSVRLLVLHPASAGHGLNLQFGGRRMVWFSCTWNLEHYLQTVARLLRRGAVDDIYIHRLIIKGTRDASVVRRVESKDTNQRYLFNEIKDLRRKYEKNK